MNERYIVHFTEYSVKFHTEAVIYKIIPLQGGIGMHIEKMTYRHDPGKEKFWRTDEEHYEAICKIIENGKIAKFEMPPHAASMIACLQRHGHVVKIYNEEE